MMSMPETEIGVGKSTVGSRSPKILCSPLQRLWRKKRENCWLLVVSEGSVRKLHLSPLKPPRSKVRIAPFPLLALKATSRIHKAFHFNNCKRNIILVIKKWEDKSSQSSAGAKQNKNSPPKKSAGLPTSTPPYLAGYSSQKNKTLIYVLIHL